MTAPSNANTSVLEACPFCGGEAWMNAYEAKYSDLPPKSRCPQCRSCGASLGYLPTPSKATEAWNRRVTAASAQARIAELEARVAELEAAKWDVKHVDTMNDMVAMGLARDAADARAGRLAGALGDAIDDLRTSLRFRGDGWECSEDELIGSYRAALQQEPTT